MVVVVVVGGVGVGVGVGIGIGIGVGPNIGKKNIFFPKFQIITYILPKSRCRNLRLDLGNTPPST